MTVDTNCEHEQLGTNASYMSVPLPNGRGSDTIAATDAEIDRLVYELYGLTEEEIAIVEGKDN